MCECVVSGYSRAVERYRQRRASLLARLERVNAALSEWDEYEAKVALSPEQRRALERPTLSRETLKDLQAMLIELVGEWEDGWEGRN